MARSDDQMTTGKVAALYGVDRSTIYRLPREKLHYELTPGGQRLYQQADVYAYARDVMGRDLGGEGAGRE